jgi:hypothetical protein
MGRLIEYIPTQAEETEATLAFILIRLGDLDKSGVAFSADDEDLLLEIEQLALKLRNKL